MELQGNKELFVTGQWKAHVQCSNCFLLFVHFEWVSRPFLAKKGCFGAESAQFWEGTPDLAPPTRGASGEFLAQNLDLARPPPGE